MACVEKVREAFGGLDEVAAVQVDFDTKTATLTAKPGRTLTRLAVEKALAGTAYGTVSFEEAAPAPVREER